MGQYMGHGNRICIYSQRGSQRLVSRCVGYEFEDVIAQIDDVDMLVSTPTRYFSWGTRVSNRLGRHLGIRPMNLGMKRSDVKTTYDVFLAVMMFPSDLVSLRAIPSWRRSAEVAVCWLEEIWKTNVDSWKGQMKILKNFDVVITNCAGSVDAVANAIGKPCYYVPPGVDALLFSPYPEEPNRCIDVYSLGRRSPNLHDALVRLASSSSLFYVYDTVLRLETDRFFEHRSLIANTAKRSKLFLVNEAKAGREFETGQQAEIGFRFFEGAAAGTVMLGSAPQTTQWQEHFGWADAVVELPSNMADLGEWLAHLSGQEQRLSNVRHTNVINSLRRHDWSYRWERILELASIGPRPALSSRMSALRDLASQGSANGSERYS